MMAERRVLSSRTCSSSFAWIRRDTFCWRLSLCLGEITWLFRPENKSWKLLDSITVQGLDSLGDARGREGWQRQQMIHILFDGNESAAFQHAAHVDKFREIRASQHPISTHLQGDWILVTGSDCEPHKMYVMVVFECFQHTAANIAHLG